MADAITLPSDLYDPVLALQYASYQWFESLKTMTAFVRPGDPTSPIKLNSNVGTLVAGGTAVHKPIFNPLNTGDTQRDLTSQVDVSTLKISSRDENGIRVSRKFGPIGWSKSAEWLSGLERGTLEQYVANEFIRRMMLTLRNFVLNAAKAAITNMTSTLHTKDVYAASGGKTNLSTQLLAIVKSLLGDRAEQLEPGSGAAWIFRSVPFYNDLCQMQLGTGVAGIADKVTRDGGPMTLGLPYATADDAALTATGGGFDQFWSLLLGPGCIELDIIKMEFEPLWKNPRDENVMLVLRGDYDFSVRIPGFAWDKTGAGTNPTLATIGTAANWLVKYTDHREVMMALSRHNSSAS